MCRMAGWIGEPRPLSALLFDPPRSLSTQAWDPREMLYGHVNVDGTGVAWWPQDDDPDAGPEPLRYVTPQAPWNDNNLPGLASRLHGRAIIGAVRSATPGIPFGPSNVAPFTHGTLAFTHNGFVQGFREGTGRAILSRLSDAAFNAYDAVSDSLSVMMLVVDHLAEGRDLPAAVAAAVHDVAEVLDGTPHGATLNVMACDGEVLVATRASIDLGNNSLYVSTDADRGGVLVASEALSPDLAWKVVPPQTLVVVRDGDVEQRAL